MREELNPTGLQINNLNINNMAKITFTADDGSTQEFDVTVPVVVAPAEVIADVKVENTDGTSETLTTEAAIPAPEVAA